MNAACASTPLKSSQVGLTKPRGRLAHIVPYDVEAMLHNEDEYSDPSVSLTTILATNLSRPVDKEGHGRVSSHALRMNSKLK